MPLATQASLSPETGNSAGPGAATSGGGAAGSTSAGSGGVGDGDTSNGATPGGGTTTSGATTGLGSTGAGPSTAGGSGATGSGPAPAPITAPLKVGLTYINNDGTSAALGVSDDATTNGETAARALVKGINAAGGLAGRILQPVEYRWNSQSSNWSQDASVACEKFTQDNRVDVVVDSAFGTTGGFGECLQKAGVYQIARGPEGDRISSQRATLHASTGSTVYERTYTAVLATLASTGYLDRTHQLGIIVEDCPPIRRAYTKTLVPLIARLGLKPPLERTIECTTSFSSAGPAASAISGAVLAFREGNVDRVLFVSDFEDVALLLFNANADSQRYYPGYALSSGAQASLFSGNVQKDQWPQLHGVGNTPGNDVTDYKDPLSVAETRCLQLARTGGLIPANDTDRGFVYNACALLLLLEAALKRTNGNSKPSAVQSAINGLGSSFSAPGLVGGRTRFSSDRHDGPDAVRVFGFVASCECIRYSGPILAAPA